jgi:hypothetical protein
LEWGDELYWITIHSKGKESFWRVLLLKLFTLSGTIGMIFVLAIEYIIQT